MSDRLVQFVAGVPARRTEARSPAMDTVRNGDATVCVWWRSMGSVAAWSGKATTAAAAPTAIAIERSLRHMWRTSGSGQASV
jgi:hypothetical protein